MNKTINKTNRIIVGLMASLLLVGSAVGFAGNTVFSFVAGKPQVQIKLSGIVNRNDEKLSIEKVGEVKPGEVLHWTIASENIGNGSANEYKAVGKIPAGTSFVENSAKAEGAANVTYSIDGGKTFSKQPMIEEKQTDGSVKSVPAPANMFTQVRFEWNAPLNPAEKLNASYDVRVK